MKRFTVILLLGLLCLIAHAQQKVYFVDGYHGGIYGHFPLWNTQFYVDKLAEFPEWSIGIEIEPETWDVAKEQTPDAYRAFQRIAGSPRVEFTNPTIAQPYMYNISGESIIRQFEYGMARINGHFPDVEFTTYAVEEPCFTSSLPQILKSLGFKYAVLKCPNTCWGGYTAPYGDELVNWVGPDGTAILCVPRYACEALSKEVWYTEASSNSDEYLAACFAAGIEHPVGMCYQDAGWRNGPWIGHGDSIKNGSIYTTWRNYFENISNGQTDDNWHFSQEDVLPGLMWGSQVLQKLAQEVRASENHIIMAEKVNAMNYMAGGTPADDALLRSAWNSLALSQHHDSWIVPYNRLTREKTWAQAITEWTAHTDSICQAITTLALKKNEDKPVNTIRVTNTTSLARTEPVEVELHQGLVFKKGIVITDDKGKPQAVKLLRKGGKTIVQFLADIPAFGYAIYNIHDAAPKKSDILPQTCKAYSSNKDQFVIENDTYRITIDLANGGVISNLIAKNMGDKEFVDASSTFGFGELRGFFYDEDRFRSNKESRTEVEILEQTPWKVSVEISNTIAGHPYSHIVTLHQGQERIDCSLTIHWVGNPGIGEYRAKDTWASNHRPSYDDRYKLLFLFPSDTGQQQVYKNAPFDVCKSRLDNTFYSTWDAIKHNVALNWVDFMGKDDQYGLTLLTDHTTSYTHGEDFPAGLTIQYSGMGLWGRDYPITGPTRVNYALIPHADVWDKAGLWTQSVAWNEPLLVHTYAAESPESNRSFITLNKQGYEISTVEVNDGQLYIRLFNAESDSTPVQVNLDFIPRMAEEVQLNGQVIAPLAVDAKNKTSTIKVSMPRFGIKTLRVAM